jgi:hypothetical protein
MLTKAPPAKSSRTVLPKGDLPAIVKSDILQAYLADPETIRRRRCAGAICAPPSGKAVWDFDVYVVPAYRLGYTFLKLWDTANAHLRSLGVRWTLSRISAFNAGSLSSQQTGRAANRQRRFHRRPAANHDISIRPKFHISFGKSRPEFLMPENLMTTCEPVPQPSNLNQAHTHVEHASSQRPSGANPATRPRADSLTLDSPCWVPCPSSIQPSSPS